jgi:type I site-specific restriction-modification system R (restriction) subunit
MCVHFQLSNQARLYSLMYVSLYVWKHQVRDRATVALYILSNMPQVAATESSQELIDGIDDYGIEEHKGNTDTTISSSKDTALIHEDDSILQPLPMSFTSLDKAVKAYASILDSTGGDSSSNANEMMVFSSLPVIEETTVTSQQQQQQSATSTRQSHATHGASDSSKSSRSSNGITTGIGGISSSQIDPAAELYKVFTHTYTHVHIYMHKSVLCYCGDASI